MASSTRGSFTYTLLSAGVGGVVLLSASDAIGQTASSAVPPAGSSNSKEITDIVVTATRRSTRVQDTPISISAIKGDDLTKLGITSPSQLNSVIPNVDFTQGYAADNVRVSIRGIGNSDYSAAGVSPVALYLDDVYQAYSFGVGTQLFDLDRVEVLRGPQGSLFGKNATAGAVNYYSAPARFEDNGYVDLDVGGGQFVHGNVQAMLNRVLVPDVLTMRADVIFNGRNDYVANLAEDDKIGHREVFAGRLQFKWDPNDALDVNLKISGQRSDGDGPIYHGFTFPGVCSTSSAVYLCPNGSPVTPVLNPNQTQSELRPHEESDNFAATLNANYRMNGFTLTSITGFENVGYQLRTNDDGEATDFFHSVQQLDAWQASQEVRLSTPADHMFSGVAGLFGMYDHFNSPQMSSSDELGPPYDYTELEHAVQSTSTGAAFGSVTFKLNDQFSVIGGLRYSYEQKSIDLRGLDLFSGGQTLSPYGVNMPGAINEKTLLSINPLDPPFPIYPALGDETFQQRETKSWGRVTGDITADYHFTRDLLLYGRYATGFRSGGFNTFAQTPETVSTVAPETLTSYEIGEKAEFFDRRFRLNGDVFDYQYTNQQIQSVAGSGAGTRLSNAGSSTLRGFELEADVLPLPNLRINTSAGYTDSRFNQFETIFNGQPISLAGNPLPYAPKWTSTAMFSYTLGLSDTSDLVATTDWTYRSRVYYDPFKLDVTSDPPSVMGNVRLTLDFDKTNRHEPWSLTAYVNNITNHKSVTFAYFSDQTVIGQMYGDLLTFGFEVRRSF